jgi:hypothetical protein
MSFPKKKRKENPKKEIYKNTGTKFDEKGITKGSKTNIRK